MYAPLIIAACLICAFVVKERARNVAAGPTTSPCATCAVSRAIARS
jgi:hypothetical protein